MTTIKEVGQSIRQSDWSITIDLQDAFLHVPVYRDYRRFLRFSWNKKIYQFRRLPLGLTSSPQVFTDITTPLVEYCRIRGIRVILSRRYTGIGKHTVTALPTQRLCLNLLHQVGFKRNQNKCRLTPSHVCPRVVVGHRQIEPYKLSRIQNSVVCTSTLDTTPETPVCIDSDRQHNGGCLPSERGGHTMQISTLSGGRDIALGPPTQYCDTTKLPTGNNEHAGRCTVAFKKGRGMDAGTLSSQKNMFNFRSPDNRLIRIREEQTTPQIFCDRQARSPCHVDRRIPSELGLQGSATVCIPPPPA